MVARVTFNLTLAPGVTYATSAGQFTNYLSFQLRSHPGGVIALSQKSRSQQRCRASRASPREVIVSASKIEEWTFVLSFVAAIAIAVALHGNEAPSFATEATAAVRNAPDYVMTVTAKRLPAECKGVNLSSSLACAAFVDANTTVDVK
jgi:hypothetical protein